MQETQSVGALRARAFSRLAVEAAVRRLRFLPAPMRVYNPSELPLSDQLATDDHPAVREQ